MSYTTEFASILRPETLSSTITSSDMMSAPFEPGPYRDHSSSSNMVSFYLFGLPALIATYIIGAIVNYNIASYLIGERRKPFLPLLCVFTLSCFLWPVADIILCPLLLVGLLRPRRESTIEVVEMAPVSPQQDGEMTMICPPIQIGLPIPAPDTVASHIVDITEVAAAQAGPKIVTHLHRSHAHEGEADGSYVTPQGPIRLIP